jgi:hypothetical protein
MIYTHTQTNSQAFVLDISDVLSEIWRLESKMGKLIKMGPPVTQRKHEWLKDDIFPNTFVSTNDAGGTLGTGETTLTILAAYGAYLRVGTLIKDTAKQVGEVYMVTGIAVSSPNTTLTLATFPAAAGATYDHAAAATWRIIARPIKEGADPSSDDVTVRGTSWNAIQLFERGIELSDEAKNIAMRGVSNEEAFQIKKKTREVKDELDYAILYGVRNLAADATEYNTMGGLIEFLTSGALVYDASGASLTVDMINDRAQAIANAGADLRQCKLLLSTNQSRVLSAIGSDRIQLRREENSRGSFVDKVLTDTGVSLEAIVEGELDSEYAGIVNFGEMQIRPLQGLGWSLYTWPRTKYAQQTTLKGDYTFEIRNVDKAHALIHGLADYS